MPKSRPYDWETDPDYANKYVVIKERIIPLIPVETLIESVEGYAPRVDWEEVMEETSEMLPTWRRAETPTFVHLDDDTVWPVDGHDVSVEWKLRYANEHLTRGDLLFAASVLSAYRAIACTRTLSDSTTKMRRARRAHMDVKP